MHIVLGSNISADFDATIQDECLEAGNHRSLPPEDDGFGRNDDKLDSMDLMEATKILLG